MNGLGKAMIMVMVCWCLSACSSSRGIYHTVQPGQTLYRIGQTYGVDERYIARLNGIEDPRSLRAGKRIFIPDVSQRKSVTAAGQKVKSSDTKARTTRASTSRSSSAPSSPPTPEISSKPPPSASRGTLEWPVKGDILKKFGEKSSGPSKGLEIASKKGREVRSAGAGRVIYSDDNIRGYGNLIILKHENNLFTVYGYNERNLVKTGASVRKGEPIAAIGTPPGGGAPRLYFEVRRGKQAVDPLFYLP